MEVITMGEFSGYAVLVTDKGEYRSIDFPRGMWFYSYGKYLHELIKSAKTKEEFQHALKQFAEKFFYFTDPEVISKADILIPHDRRTSDLNGGFRYVKNISSHNIEVYCDDETYILEPGKSFVEAETFGWADIKQELKLTKNERKWLYNSETGEDIENNLSWIDSRSDYNLDEIREAYTACLKLLADECPYYYEQPGCTPYYKEIMGSIKKLRESIETVSRKAAGYGLED